MSQLVQNVTGRCDRVAGVEQRLAGQFRSRDQSVGRGLVAGDLAILARPDRGLGHLVMRDEGLGRLAVKVARLQRANIRLGNRRLLAELLLDHSQRRLQRSIVQPVHQPQGEKVLASVRFLQAQAQPLDGVPSQLGHRHCDQAVAVQAAVLQRILFIVSFG